MFYPLRGNGETFSSGPRFGLNLKILINISDVMYAYYCLSLGLSGPVGKLYFPRGNVQGKETKGGIKLDKYPHNFFT
jgi:hypothetical protein